MRNPHGDNEFSGRFSDESSHLTEDIKRQFDNYVADTDDGTFLITVNDFMNEFEYLSVHYDIEDWHRSDYI